MNSSFIALIPKTPSPIEVQEFRPISLINCTLKILLKVLASRIKLALNDIISETQFAFIKGRSIADCILITGELSHSIQYNLTEGIILKIDIEKAFDTVRWDLLLTILELQGFGEKWIMWIKAIISSAKLSVLVNGSPTKEFSMGK